MRLAICVVFLLALFGANAAEFQEILDVETTGLGRDEIDATLHLKSVNNATKAIGLILQDNVDQEIKNYDVSKLRAGVVLKSLKNKKVIILKSHDFNPSAGGNFKLQYLHNGIKGTYHEVPLTIKLAKSQYRWVVYKDNKEVKGMNFVVKKHALFGAIGIDRIVTK
jgi:hypothetical protein